MDFKRFYLLTLLLLFSFLAYSSELSIKEKEFEEYVQWSIDEINKQVSRKQRTADQQQSLSHEFVVDLRNFKNAPCTLDKVYLNSTLNTFYQYKPDFYAYYVIFNDISFSRFLTNDFIEELNRPTRPGDIDSNSVRRLKLKLEEIKERYVERVSEGSSINSDTCFFMVSLYNFSPAILSRAFALNLSKKSCPNL